MDMTTSVMAINLVSVMGMMLIGWLISILWHNVTLTDDLGRRIGTLSSGEDVTDHKILEEQLRHAQKMEGIGKLADIRRLADIDPHLDAPQVVQVGIAQRVDRAAGGGPA